MFQRFIHRALGDLEFVFCYIDDVLIASSNDEEHEMHLKVVFQRLRDFGFRINFQKCVFGKEELEFLEHMISEHGCRPTPEKVKAVVEFPKPKTIVELRRFLGIVNFYRRNLPGATIVQEPLNRFLKDSNKMTSVVWSGIRVRKLLLSRLSRICQMQRCLAIHLPMLRFVWLRMLQIRGWERH